MTGSLVVRIDKFLDGESIEAGVAFTARAARGPDGRSLRPFARDGVAAVGRARGQPPPWAVMELPAGQYEVEAVLPSGETLVEEVGVLEGERTELVLRGEPSPREWRSWAQFGRSRPASGREKANAATFMVSGPASPLEGRIRVTIGPTLVADAPFDPGGWRDWERWLEDRAARAEEAAAPGPLSLTGDPEGLTFEIVGGGDDSLAVVQVRGTDGGRWYGDASGRRQFICVSSNLGERVFALPWPWPRSWSPDGDPMGSYFDLQVAERDGRLLVDPTLRDAAFGGIIAYLNAGRVGRAGQLLQLAQTALFEKWENPLAAAAGGYVLLSTAESADLEAWPQWLANLAEHFPHVPDGPILRARWLLEQGRRDGLQEAHDLLVQSVERGVPFFATGVVWLIEGLRRVGIECEACRDLLRMVRGVARSMDLSQAFTAFDLQAPNVREESLRPALDQTPPTTEAARTAPRFRVADGVRAQVTWSALEEVEQDEDEDEEDGEQQVQSGEW